MENNQNQDAQAKSAANRQGTGKSGGNRHGRRGGHHHRSSQRRNPQEGAEQKQQAVGQDEGSDVAAEKAAQQPDKSKQQQKSGERSRSQSGRRGRGRGNAQKDAAPAEKETAAVPKEDKTEGRRRSPSKELSTEELYAASSIGTARGFFDSLDRREDSFLPIHEEHRPDPEAEKFAAALLDAEGPLLAQNREEEPPVEAPVSEGPPAEEDTPVEIVGIRFRRTGKVYFFDPGVHKLKAGTYAVVETARGLEYGEVYRGNSTVPQKQIVPPLRPVIRPATKEDTRHFEENKAREQDAFRICQDKIAAHKLDMKLVEAEYTFDNTKLLFYFTSAGRVDFRELVKDLAGVFRTRIELRQIGIRDEAKLLGGLGTCGRPLCCASFLADFVQVSIKMAKEQSLSLNSTKISGCCGRLMCCLRYEQDTYEEEIRRTPSVNSLLNTPEGQGTVISNNPLRGTVRVRLGGEEGTVKEFHRDDVQIVRSVQPPQEEE